MIATEHDLAALCGALIDDIRLPAAERQLIRRSIILSARSLKAVRAAMRAGDDPLGEAFCRIRSPELRRSCGFRLKPPIIPKWRRPPIRDNSAHRSEMISPAIPG